jgi:hypothetical protein
MRPQNAPARPESKGASAVSKRRGRNSGFGLPGRSLTAKSSIGELRHAKRPLEKAIRRQIAHNDGQKARWSAPRLPMTVKSDNLAPKQEK